MFWDTIFGIAGIVILVAMLIGAAGARWDAPAWVVVPTLVILGILVYTGVLDYSWQGIGTSLMYVAIFLFVGALYTWAWWEIKLNRTHKQANMDRTSIMADYAASAIKNQGGTVQDYMLQAQIIPQAVNNKAEITGRVIVWPMHLLGDVLVYPGKWILAFLRYLRDFFDRRAKAKFSDF